MSPMVETILVYSDVHLLAGSVRAETGSENAGNLFGAQGGQRAKRVGSLWDNELEENDYEWDFSTDSNE